MWQYEVFKESMNSRINAQGLLALIFVIISAVMYEKVIDESS